MDVKTTKRLKVIVIKNCLNITLANGKAYVCAYDGEVQFDEVSPNGFVAEIDTSTLAVMRTVQEGRQPKEMAVVGSKLYIANSGCYSPRNYERTVSLIDLNTFVKIKYIDIAVNLHRLRTDAYGNLWASSRGDNVNESSKLLDIDRKTDAVKKIFDIACANLTIVGDTAYIIGFDLSYTTFDQTISNSMINVKIETPLAGGFLPKADW